MKNITTRQWIALVSIASVIGAGMYLWFTLDVTHASNVKEVITTQNQVYSQQKAKDYLIKNLLTEHQANYVLSQLDKVENKDHFVARFGAIFRHENGKEFVNSIMKDGKNTNNGTKRLAGRLKEWMQNKPFWVQFDGRIDQYNRTWYKNNSVNDWIYKSSYCVTDSYWGWGKGCPNWQKNVGAIVASYWLVEVTEPTIRAEKVYPKAREAQSKADKLWEACKILWECTQ